MPGAVVYLSSHSGDATLTHATLVLTWIFTSLAIVAVVLRFYLRRKLTKRWASHDWIMLAALACQLVYQAGITILCQAGSGKPAESLTENQLPWKILVEKKVDTITLRFTPVLRTSIKRGHNYY